VKAIVQDRYGNTDVLHCAEITRPAAGPGEVLLRVRAAGVDRGVWHLMTGLPYLARVVGFGVRRPKARVRGMDVAGVVEAVGPGVTGLRPRDEVFGVCDGAFAEYALARADRLVPKPANVTFEQAAAVPASAATALHALRDTGRVRAGARVLVIGASGGVGSFAVQLGKVFGAHVTGVCRTSKMDLVRTLGADEVIDHTRTELTGRYDLVLDIAGNRPLRALRRLLTPGGTLVLVGGEDNGRVLGGVDRSLGAMLLSPLVRGRMRGLVSITREADLRQLAGWLESGALVPAVERSFPLADAAAAIDHMTSGAILGKVVVTVGG
jgi:NADPH:quinone reductase-like Zn-dependent oxidoreductase